MYSINAKKEEEEIYTADCNEQKFMHLWVTRFCFFALKQRTEIKKFNFIIKWNGKFSTCGSEVIGKSIRNDNKCSPCWFYNHSLRLKVFQSNCVSKFIFPPKTFLDLKSENLKGGKRWLNTQICTLLDILSLSSTLYNIYFTLTMISKLSIN